MGVEHYAVFILSSVVYSLTPGIDFLLVLNRSLFYGRRAGLVTSLGINSGLVVHTALAALGISALVASSDIAFPILKYAGAAYLVLFGLLTLLRSGRSAELKSAAHTTRSDRFYFLSGVMTNLFNPKIILFFIAFFPQFVSREAMGNPLPYMVLGVSYTVTSLICLSFLCLFASSVASRVLQGPRFTILMHRVTGVLFIVMGLNVAFLKQ